MRKLVAFVCIAVFAVACTSRDVGPYAPTTEEKSLEQIAATKSMCVIQNQARCDHLIENRSLFSRFFAPATLGGLDESEKFRGRRITTKFVVEALAATNQCVPPSGPSVTIVKGMEIDKRRFDVKGTSPLLEQQSSCFITPSSEES
ncbi:MAG: hypothetical protein QNJ29_11920 [Rhizobiaceae bacterium]|nr:hypothetical protein [Rhizobiaceae bacterium]